MPRFPARAIIVALAVVAVAGPAWAAKRIYSYDSANKETEAMTDQGLTFVFEKTLLSTRVERVLETVNMGEAEVRPASQSALGPGGLGALIGASRSRDLYEIEAKGDGVALIKALCPGADRAWLALGALRTDAPLRVHALGHDAATGRTRLCITLDYSFHGQWAVAPPDLPQPDRNDRFNDAPANRRY
jgi:hypothetical protein